VTTPERVEFELLGQTYTIRSEASPEYVRELVRYIERKLGSVGGDAGSDRVKRLALVTLYITDELFRARDEQARAAGDVDARVGTLLELLNRVAPPAADSP
jgi:cell division protein ZapA (FtsZ GTPase activity inhibitor)